MGYWAAFKLLSELPKGIAMQRLPFAVNVTEANEKNINISYLLFSKWGLYHHFRFCSLKEAGQEEVLQKHLRNLYLQHVNAHN